MRCWAAFLVVNDWRTLAQLAEIRVSPEYANRLDAEHIAETAHINPDIIAQHAALSKAYPRALLTVRTKGLN